MSSDMNIPAAVGMSSGNPSHRLLLEQTWSSVSHLVNMSSKQASFFALLIFFSDVIISKGSIGQSRRCPPLMLPKWVAPSAVAF